MTGADLVAVDIGGTHVRFALARITAGGVALGPATVVRTADHDDLAAAWRAFAAASDAPLPPAAAIAVACPVGGERLRLTNNAWTLCPADLPADLGVARLTLVNDFAAVAHAVAVVEPAALVRLCGPDRPLDLTGVVSVVGPGTGLGVAALVGTASGIRVVATEGGHIAFAPADAFDDALLARLRARYGRVSVERVVAGPGLGEIYALLGAQAGRAVTASDDATLWTAALGGNDDLAVAALDRFCATLGAVAGDVALAHGGFGGVVIAGGLGLRLAGHLPRSGFAAAFAAKGRFAALMAGIPVKVLTHPQPGLLGAAAAFAREHGQPGQP